MKLDADPSRTHAIIVGVEHYGTKDWSLVGPENDGVAFANWLTARHVPAGNIHVLISPADGDLERLRGRLPLGVDLKKDARRDSIHDMLAEDLPALEGELLFLFWGGHGVVADSESRRLLYANASPSNPDNLDFTSLRRTFRSSMVKIRRQVCLVDACANSYESMRLALQTRGGDLPYGNTDPPVQQFFIFACATGQATKNRTLEKTGAFSEFVLAWLNGSPPDGWPDFMELFNALQKRFYELRQTKEARQTPVFYMVDSGDIGSHQELGTLPQPVNVQSTAFARNLSIAQLGSVVDAMSHCSSLQEQPRRDELVGRLDASVRAEVRRDPDTRTDLLNFLVASLRDDATLESLWDNLAVIEPNAPAVLAARETMDRVLTAGIVRTLLADLPVMSATLFRTYVSCAPDRQRAKRGADLDGMIESLLEMAPDPGGIPRVAEFVARLNRLAGGPREELTNWLKDHLEGNQIADLSARLSAEDAAASGRPPFLVIDVGMTSGAKPEPEFREAWLYLDVAGTPSHWVAEDLKAKAFDAALSEVILGSRVEAGADLVVEIMLPRELMCTAVDLWEVGGELGPPAPIGIDNPVVVRWRDRFRNQQNAQPGFWRKKAETIRQRLEQGLEPAFLWIDEIGHEPRLLRSELAKPDGGDCVGLLFVPPELPGDLRSDIMIAALIAGAPFLLWTRCAPDDWKDLRDQLQDLSKQQVWNNLPKLIKDERVSAFAARGQAPSGSIAGVSLLWDLPEHTPQTQQLVAPVPRNR
jgi:hypothetical protein